MKAKRASGFNEAMDDLFEMVGSNGKFQRNFGWIFNCACLFVLAMISQNVYFTFAIPKHWCHVPGRDLFGYSEVDWRNLTVPSDGAIHGLPNFSKCQMYDINWADFDRHELMSMLTNGSHTDRPVIDCRHGWEYDKEWFEKTAVSQENWVCEKDMYQTNTFAYGRLGEVLGSIVFGQLGDWIGRRKMFLISIIVLVLGKISMIFAVSNFALVAISAVLGSLASNSVFQAPLIISMETNKPEKRASIALQQNVSWSVSMCVMPLLFWVIRDWEIFFWVTTIPLLIFLCFPSYMIESPRWLANSGRLAECAKCLTNIARLNGRPTAEITESYLKKILPEMKSREQVYGMLSFFTGWRIARNTLLLVFCWVTCSLAYFTLLLSVADLPGNPFLNFLIQSLIEFPSYFAGERLSNYIGRRLTNSISFAFAGLFTAIQYFIFADPAYATLTIALTFIVKFCVTITFFAVNLQCMETHPTCLRQTGISLGILLANIFGMLGPYIVYLGKHYDPQYPYIILFGMFAMGTICGMFTIETYMQKLPDTVEEAMHFGEDQKFWSMPRGKKEPTDITAEAEGLNQLQYSP